MLDVNQRIKSELQALQKEGLLRRRYLFDKKNNETINFCSNDYLSLSTHPDIQMAYKKAFEKTGTGSGGSMLLGGYHSAHQRLERAFADFLEVESALLFSSGYAANLAVMSLAKRLDLHCLIDKRVHASIYDGLAMSQARYSRFKHNDAEQLRSKMTEISEPLVIITEGIFSMSGQMASLNGLQNQLQSNQFLWIDEAHSFGVLGKKGRGVADLYSFSQQQLPLRIIPLGKSCAAQGAIVAGKREWIELLIQAGRSYIFSTAVSPALAEGILCTLAFIEQADDRRNKLDALVKYFIEKRNTSSYQWMETRTAIQYLKLGSCQQALSLSNALEQYGIHCFTVRPPTVPAMDSGIRFVLNYAHQFEDIDKLFNTLEMIRHENSF